MDSKEIYVFSLNHHVVIWMGSDVPMWISSKVLAVAKAYVQNVHKLNTNFEPYYLWDELHTSLKYFVFVAQGKEPHRFKNLFKKWKPLPNPYYHFSQKRILRQKFRTEKKFLRSQDISIKTKINQDDILYWKCIKNMDAKKAPRELPNTIVAFPYNLIYGFKVKEKRISLPVYLHHIEVYEIANKTLIRLLGKSKYIWNTRGNYIVVITYMSSPNSKPLYCVYLWCGGNI